MSKDLTLGFGRFDPFTVGFDNVWNKLSDMLPAAANVPTFPPYNIRKVSDNEYVIEVAVAGFAKQDISVTLEGDKLIVKGVATSVPSSEGEYLHRGIAMRAFERSWLVQDGVEIKNAEMVNGMLRLWLENIHALNKRVKQIEIKDGAEEPKGKKQLLTE
jgi:molecular chaperone IbpA